MAAKHRLNSVMAFLPSQIQGRIIKLSWPSAESEIPNDQHPACRRPQPNSAGSASAANPAGRTARACRACGSGSTGHRSANAANAANPSSRA
jgi:hypothetical protein